jgi:peptidoglycan hydrolase-like protein with peptidoglycan-binding domain
MDPITEPSGVRARLANLGYRGVSDDNVGAEWNEPGLVYALSAFQRDQHLEVTGTLDDATRDALQERYGT